MLNLDFVNFPLLETERLHLRSHQNMDAEVIFNMRQNEQVMQYVDREKPHSITEVKLQIENINEGFTKGDSLAWVITLKENPAQCIGSIGFWRTDYGNHRAEVGYMLHPDFWRKGYCTEALAAVLNYGFKVINLHSIKADINPGNAASRQLLLKHNFKKEAYFKENFYFNGRYLDSEIYGLLNPNHR